MSGKPLSKRNLYAKYEGSFCKGTKLMTNVKVVQQTNKPTNRQSKTSMSPLSLPPTGDIKSTWWLGYVKWNVIDSFKVCKETPLKNKSCHETAQLTWKHAWPLLWTWWPSRSCDLAELKETFLASTRILYIWFQLWQRFKELEMFLKYTDRCLFPHLLI